MTKIVYVHLDEDVHAELMRRKNGLGLTWEEVLKEGIPALEVMRGTADRPLPLTRRTVQREAPTG